jgi:hypothetical protein
VGADQQPVPIQQLLGGAEHLHTGGRQHDQVVADSLQVGQQVRGQHHGHALLGDRAHQRLEELAPGQRVEVGQRLVQKEQLGSLGQGQGQGDLGALAAGQGADPAVQRHGDPLQPAAGQSLVEAGVELGAKGQVLGGGEVAVQRGVLGHEADLGEQPGVAGSLAEDTDAAGGGGQQAHGQVEQGGLAGAIGADQGGDATLWDGQVAVAQGPGASVALAEPAGLQRRAHAMPS